jgi:2-polyprenyl-3-methyl-5-hydroxy-6-metoxy-1,4-benzoquinol methylase
MRHLAEREFRTLYDTVVGEVIRFLTPAMQREIAAHNHGWSAGSTDFDVYLRASWVRYFRAYRHLVEQDPARTVCDVGGFWGAWPVTLARAGYRVTMTESLKYYSRTFDGLFEFLRAQGVEILDYDPFEDKGLCPGPFDFVTVMAVLEHYPHSLRGFMERVCGMTEDRGRLYLEAPNIAFWRKRIELLLGRTPLTPLREIWLSDVPFIGHHHELTLVELRELCSLAGLTVTDEACFNYSPGNLGGARLLFSHPLRSLAFRFLPDSREVIGVLCRKEPGPEPR